MAIGKQHVSHDLHILQQLYPKKRASFHGETLCNSSFTWRSFKKMAIPSRHHVFCQESSIGFDNFLSYNVGLPSCEFVQYTPLDTVINSHKVCHKYHKPRWNWSCFNAPTWPSIISKSHSTPCFIDESPIANPPESSNVASWEIHSKLRFQ